MFGGRGQSDQVELYPHYIVYLILDLEFNLNNFIKQFKCAVLCEEEEDSWNGLWMLATT